MPVVLVLVLVAVTTAPTVVVPSFVSRWLVLGCAIFLLWHRSCSERISFSAWDSPVLVLEFSSSSLFSERTQKVLFYASISSGKVCIMMAGLAVWIATLLAQYNGWRRIIEASSWLHGTHPFLESKGQLGMCRDFYE